MPPQALHQPPVETRADREFDYGDADEHDAYRELSELDQVVEGCCVRDDGNTQEVAVPGRSRLIEAGNALFISVRV